MGTDLAADLAELERVVDAVERHDAEIRTQIVELSDRLAEICKRGCIGFVGENFTIEELPDDERIYGYLYVSEQGIWLAHRSSYDDLSQAMSDDPTSDITYTPMNPRVWPLSWLREIDSTGKLEPIVVGLKTRGEAVLQGRVAIAERGRAVGQRPLVAIEDDLLTAAREWSFSTVVSEWSRAQRAVNSSPESAVRAACVLVETTLRHLLRFLNVDYPSDESVHSLYKALSKKFDMRPNDRGAPSLRGILSALNSLVHNIGVHRTKVSDAHGQDPTTQELSIDEARLAVNAAGTLCAFLMRHLTAHRGNAT